MTVEELMGPDSQEKLNKLAKAQLQIVIICPKLTAKMADLKRETNMENLFKVDKVLVMLLGVEKNDVVADNAAGKDIGIFIGIESVFVRLSKEFMVGRLGTIVKLTDFIYLKA